MAPKRTADKKAPEPAHKKAKGHAAPAKKGAAVDHKSASKRAAPDVPAAGKRSPLQQKRKEEEAAKAGPAAAAQPTAVVTVSAASSAAPSAGPSSGQQEAGAAAPPEIVMVDTAPEEETPAQHVEPAAEPVVEQKPLTPEEMCTSVVDALKATDIIPSSCLEMLASMVSSCLRPAVPERHPYQAAALALLARAMKDIEDSLDRSAKHFSEQVATAAERGFANTKAEVQKRAEQIEKKADELIAAKQAVERTRETLAESVKNATGLDDNSAKDAEERDACQAALEYEIPLVKDGVTMFRNGGFVRPDDPQHVEKLQPLLKRIGFEDTLLQALPVAATRAINQRGNFDRMVLEQVARRLEEHTAMLKARLLALPSTIAEREAAVQGAQQACLEAEATHRQTAATLEVMETEKAALEAAFEERKQQAVREAEAARDKACASLTEFRKGPLAAYQALETQGTEALAAEKALGAAEQEQPAGSQPKAAADVAAKPAAEAMQSPQQLPTPCRSTLEARVA
eukprot:TRINITY_DN21661_c0_g1_i1.p1 TRINITY_DN21661_c0_g1~~TRINITY_DN21661_c0_g1_i1.p1  ORF type:complete len:514 (-),score=176.56 TRINITY_DN21661_c0_g1_i1:136-1677(-)